MRDAGRALLLAALVAYPLVAGKNFRWQVLVMHCVVALAVLLWYIGHSAVGARPRIVRYRLLDGAMLAFAAWCVVAVVPAVYKYAAVVFLVAMLDCLLVYWMAREGFTEGRWRWAVPTALVTAGAVCGLWAVREYAHTVILTGNVIWRVFGPLYNPNVLASYLVGPLLAGVALLMCRHHWLTTVGADGGRHARGNSSNEQSERPRYGLIALGFSLLLIGPATLLTGSRAGIVGLLAGLVLFILMEARPGRSRRTAAVTSAALVAVAVAAVLLVPPLQDRVIRNFSLDNHSVAFRYYTWLGTLDMACDRPLLGFGPGSYEYAYPAYARAGFTRTAHQSFLQMAAEVGWIGMIVAVVAGLAALWRCGRRAQSDSAPGAAVAAAAGGWLLALAVHNLADYSMYIAPVSVSAAALLGAALMPQAGREADRWAEVASASGATDDADARDRLGAYVVLGMVLLAGLCLAVGEALAVRSGAELQRGRYYQAEDLARASVRIVPFSAEGWEALAAVHEARVRSADSPYLPKAIQARQQALRWAPTSARSYRALARLYGFRSDTAQALEYAGEAVERYPTGARELVELAQMQHQAGLRAEAEATYRRTLELLDGPVGRYAAVPELPELAYVWAWAYLAQRAYTAGDIAEGDRMVYEGLMLLIRRLGGEELRFELEQSLLGRRPPEMAEMEAMADRLAEVMRPHPDPINLLRLAEVRRRLGQWALQEAALMQVVGAADSAGEHAQLLRGVAHLEMGQLYEQWKQRDQAASEYATGLEAISGAGEGALERIKQAAGRSPVNVERLRILMQSAEEQATAEQIGPPIGTREGRDGQNTGAARAKSEPAGRP